MPSTSGVPQAITDLTLVVGFNDLDAVRRRLAENPGQIAGMILEPIMMNAGIIKPDPGYLAGLKELLHASGALLTFDEVKTGLTAGPGGATGVTGVTPDIICLAKAIGGGIAVAAVGGTAEVMAHVANGDYEMVGTFNGNPLAMAACKAMLTEVATSRRLRAAGEAAAAGRRGPRARDRAQRAQRPGRLRRRQGLRGVLVRAGPQLPRLPGRAGFLQPRALAVPAQRRGLPATVGQDRAVAHVGPA